VPRDAFDAYAYSKRALQSAAERQIREVATAADQGVLPGILSADAAVRLRADRYEQIKGRRPDWMRT
jgi:hypothetical protein